MSSTITNSLLDIQPQFSTFKLLIENSITRIVHLLKVTNLATGVQLVFLTDERPVQTYSDPLSPLLCVGVWVAAMDGAELSQRLIGTT